MSKKQIIILIVSFVVVILLTVGITLLVVNKNKEDDEDDNSSARELRKAKITLSTYCSNINSLGNFSDESDTYCKDFVCYVYGENYIYSRNCLDENDKVTKERR